MNMGSYRPADKAVRPLRRLLWTLPCDMLPDCFFNNDHISQHEAGEK